MKICLFTTTNGISHCKEFNGNWTRIPKTHRFIARLPEIENSFSILHRKFRVCLLSFRFSLARTTCSRVPQPKWHNLDETISERLHCNHSNELIDVKRQSVKLNMHFGWALNICRSFLSIFKRGASETIQSIDKIFAFFYFSFFYVLFYYPKQNLFLSEANKKC